jgi:hypothetical protein
MKKLTADDLRPYERLNLMYFKDGSLIQEETATRLPGGKWHTVLKIMRTGIVINDMIDTHTYLILLNERKDAKIFGVKNNPKGQPTFTRLR